MDKNFTLEADEMAQGFVLSCQARATTKQPDGQLRRALIGQQVVDVLDADRQAHHVFAHAGLGQFLGRQLAVRGGGRVAGQRLGVADVDQAGEQLQRILEARAGRAGRRRPGLQAEGLRMPEARPPMYFCTSAWSGWSGRPA
jgi:hypothetical protein